VPIELWLIVVVLPQLPGLDPPLLLSIFRPHGIVVVVLVNVSKPALLSTTTGPPIVRQVIGAQH